MTEPNNILSQQLNQLSALYNIQNILQNIYNNLALISEGDVGKTINVNNVSLFALAAQYYGDATSWTVIAQANGLYDPMITSPMQLVIPTTAVNTGGILEI